CRALEVDAVRVVATSATRDVRNRDEFVARVLARTGVEPEVLSGELEAAATWAGATAELPGGERTLVVDIGGGSTELIIGVPGRPATTPEAIVSLDIGCVRLTERHLHADPPTAREVAELRGERAPPRGPRPPPQGRPGARPALGQPGDRGGRHGDHGGGARARPARL